jgi:hypothetical protein
VGEDDLPDAIQFLRGEAVVVRQGDGIEPELANAAIPTDVDMPRLVAVETLEKEAVRAGYAGDSRHGKDSGTFSR